MVKGKELKRITENGYCKIAVAVFLTLNARIVDNYCFYNKFIFLRCAITACIYANTLGCKICRFKVVVNDMRTIRMSILFLYRSCSHLNEVSNKSSVVNRSTCKVPCGLVFDTVTSSYFKNLFLGR